MRYARLLAWIAGGIWAVRQEKAQIILGFLAQKAAGVPSAPAFRADEDDEHHDRRREFQAAIRPATGASNGPSVAVLPLTGLISPRAHDVADISSPGGVAAETWAATFRHLAADPNIASIVIDVDSPGGNVLGVHEAAAAVIEARGSKPIIAVANHTAASAAYWLASAADEIVVTPSGEVGSIGVYSYHEDLSRAIEAAGVTPTLLKAGDNKAEGHPAFPLSPEAAAHMQARVDDYYAMFVRDVAMGRNVSELTVREDFGGGRMFGAAEAVRRSMADRIGTLEDEIARLVRDASAQAQTSAALGMRARRLALA